MSRPSANSFIQSINDFFSGLPRPVNRGLRILALLLIDAASLYLAIRFAQLVRFDGDIPRQQSRVVHEMLPWLMLTYLGMMAIFRQYTILWRYATGRELLTQAGILVLAGGLTLLWNDVFEMKISRAVLGGACLYMIGLATASRLFARSLRARLKNMGITTSRDIRNPLPLLIVGAGDAASFVLTQNRRGGSFYGRPVGLVDDADEKQHMRVQNVPVLGKIADIPALVTRLGVREIVIAMPSVAGERLQQIIEICNATRCQVRIMSDPQSLGTGTGRGAVVLREPNMADFLSREEVRIDDEQVGAYLSGKTVLVTGGGGSIGSEICRQVMKYAPARLLIFDIYENCAYELLVELQREYGSACPAQVLIGSVRDPARLDEVMLAHNPQVIFHAAAHKHVPLMEISPVESVKNNVFGTLNVLRSGENHGVERFVMLSTDKAVNPTSIMGATKRMAEITMQQFARTSRMRCCAVRFGNVLGSHGSVIPLFESQIRAGGPVTLTHPDITRFFMTIPEAASLVLQAGSMAESGRIYILDMGEPVRIAELARKLIRFYGFDPEVDMPIQVTGLRPGEKLYEELLMDDEQSRVVRTHHEKIMVAPPLETEAAVVEGNLKALRQAVAEADGEAVYTLTRQMVPGFRRTPNQPAAGPDDGSA